MTGVVFLDLKKAFDTVDHNILLQKLNMYGIAQNTGKWFESYPKGRKQATKVNGVMSEYSNVQCGVPQGSILGPLLFILYINDLSKYLTTCTANLYADDTAIYYSGESQIDIILAL